MISMSKTMKMLYCCICFRYDCGRHRLEEIPEKNYHYVAPKNVISPSEHIRKAMTLLSYQNSKPDIKKKCSELCFKIGNTKEVE